MGADAWATVAVGILGAIGGGVTVYASVRERLARLEEGHKQLGELVKAGAAENATSNAKVERLVLALLERPEYDRRHGSRRGGYRRGDDG